MGYIFMSSQHHVLTLAEVSENQQKKPIFTLFWKLFSLNLLHNFEKRGPDLSIHNTVQLGRDNLKIDSLTCCQENTQNTKYSTRKQLPKIQREVPIISQLEICCKHNTSLMISKLSLFWCFLQYFFIKYFGSISKFGHFVQPWIGITKQAKFCC